jgi:hypothetical protein
MAHASNDAIPMLKEFGDSLGMLVARRAISATREFRCDGTIYDIE